MPWCVAVDCGNNTFTKNREEDASFYYLPNALKLRKRWLENIKHENILKTRKFVINISKIPILKGIWR